MLKISIGIGGSNHDFATCLINQNGQIFAIEDERISRLRYALFDPKPCEQSYSYVLELAGISPADIDHIVGNDYLSEPYFKSAQVGDSHIPSISRINQQNFPPIIFLNHHLSHAYSTFFTSTFDEAAILVADGTGSLANRNSLVPERETMTLSVGSFNSITTLGSVLGKSTGSGFNTGNPPLYQNSLGHMYRAVTQVVGFGWMNAGKTMGLASYGDNRYVESIMHYIRLLPEGKYEINLGGKDGLLEKLIQFRDEGHIKHDMFSVNAALAFGIQTALENIMFHALDFLWERTKVPNLCLAGGIALNGLFNGKISKRTNFKNIHVIFAPGDCGTAIGAAIWDYLYRREISSNIIRFTSGPFWGRQYDEIVIKKIISGAGLVATKPINLHQEVAQLIADGKTLAWFEGSAEFGPRALGHRSILGDPRNPTMLDHINKDIKKREWFRPIAPAVTEPASSIYFETECYSPYMQFVWPVREQYRTLLPAITHIDGGSRIQSVRKQENESLYALLEAFERITGFPILINTSFNINGEPIVETPKQAIDTFLLSALDALVLEGYLICK